MEFTHWREFPCTDPRDGLFVRFIGAHNGRVLRVERNRRGWLILAPGIEFAPEMAGELPFVMVEIERLWALATAHDFAVHGG